MKSKFTPTLLIFTIVLYHACSQGKKQNESFTVLKEINQFNDSTFFTKVSDITAVGNQLFILDKKLSKTYVTNHNLELLSDFGIPGKGPKELASATRAFADKQHYYIYDGGNGKILAHSISEHSEISNIPFNYFDIGKSFITDSVIFFNTRRSKEHPINTLNLATNETHSFGQAAEKGLNTPIRHLVDNNQGFFSIYGENAPIINYYSYQGELIKQFDFSNEGIFKNRLAVKDSDQLTIKGASSPLPVYKNVIWDATFNSGYLYLLALSQKNETTVKSNTILKLSWSNNHLSIEKSYELPEKGWYSKFEIIDKGQTAIVFDEENGTLEKLNIQ